MNSDESRLIGTCVFCQKDLKDPMVLKCGHSICAGCVEDSLLFSEVVEMFAPQKRKKTEENVEKGSIPNCVKCPLCNTKTLRDEIKPNIVLRAVAEREAQVAAAANSSDKKIFCGFCKEPATKMCVFCGPLCDKHSDFLHVNGPMRTHELSQIESGKLPRLDWSVSKSSDFSMNKMPVCSLHHKRCDLVCQSCNTLICPHCMMMGQHKNHKCEGINSFLKTVTPSILAMAKEIREGIPSCQGLFDGFEFLEKNAEKERKDFEDEINKRFAEIQEKLEKSRKDVLRNLDTAYDEFNSSVGGRKNALKTLQEKCEDFISRLATEDSLPESVVARYALFRILGELKNALTVIRDTNAPDEKTTICRVVFNPKLSDSSLFLASVLPTFRLGSGKKKTCDINMETLRNSRSFSSPINALDNTSHDGSAFYDPTRNAIFAVSGNANNCMDVFVTRLTDPTHGETERRANVIPYPSHGQYPIFDGVRYAYFCESEGDANNRFGRLDLDTFVFEELANIPGSFREFNSGCFSLGKIYAISEDDESIVRYDPDEDSWEDVGINIEGECRLLADPLDEGLFYCFKEGDRGLYSIDVNTRTQTLISTPPSRLDLGQNGEALVVSLPDTSRVLFTSLSDRWYFYSFADQTWTPLENWDHVHNGSAHLVVIPDGPVALYHIDQRDNWTGVNLR